MSQYRPSLNPASTTYNSADFEYQDESITLKDADHRYMLKSVEVSDHATLTANTLTNTNNIATNTTNITTNATNITTLTTKTAGISVASGVTSISTLQPTGAYDFSAMYPKNSYLNTKSNTIFTNTSLGSSQNANNISMLAIGANAGNLVNIVNAGYYVAIGGNALGSQISATHNLAIGATSALGAITTGGGNISLGNWSNAQATIINRCISIGYQSLFSTTGGQTLTDNVAMGYYSGFGCITGAVQNTFLGNYSGQVNTTGANNLFLGYQSGTSSSPSGAITTESNIVCIGNSSIATIYQQVASTVVSDALDKCGIEDLDMGLDFVDQLLPKKYFMNDRNKYKEISFDPDTGIETITELTNDESKKDERYSVGLLAQDVMTVQENLSTDVQIATQINANKLGIRYESLIPILINAIKELKARVEVLENA